MSQSVPQPSIKLTAFACPHCGTHSTQFWHDGHYQPRERNSPNPLLVTKKLIEERLDIRSAKSDEEKEAINRARIWAEKAVQGEPFLEPHDGPKYVKGKLENIFVSECFTCRKLAIWLHDKILYPATMVGPAPNADLPADVLRDYEEARTVLELSPRGAAALLRLAVEKLCDLFEAKGDTVNDQIGWLVANKNLNPVIEQALDAVRVIGNEAVHPGQIDLRDDRDTATKLFDLVNIIAEEMITRPKNVKALHAMISAEKLKAIEERNAKAIAQNSDNAKE